MSARNMFIAAYNIFSWQKACRRYFFTSTEKIIPNTI